jgi:hypothetical protein
MTAVKPATSRARPKRVLALLSEAMCRLGQANNVELGHSARFDAAGRAQSILVEVQR